MFGIEPAAVEQQRRSAGAKAAALDLAHENDVIALLIATAVEAFECGCGAIEQGRAADALDVVHILEAVGAAQCEPFSQRLLAGRQVQRSTSPTKMTWSPSS